MRLLGAQGVTDLLEKSNLGILFFSFFFEAELGSATFVELVDGCYDAEVNSCCDEQEVNNCGQENADLDVPESQELVKALSADKSGDSRHKNRLNQGSDNGGEGGANNQTNCQVDDVTAGDEIFKSTKHKSNTSALKGK